MAQTKSVDVLPSVNSTPSTISTHASQVPYPSGTEQETITITDPSPPMSTGKSSQAVTLTETVAWALLSLVTLMFIGLLSVNIMVLWINKRRKTRNNESQAPVYEMAGNPCYESSKTSNTVTLETNVYESCD